MSAYLDRICHIAGVESTKLTEAVKYKNCEEMMRSFVRNMEQVRRDLEETKGTDEIDDALDHFDSIMKQFQNAEVVANSR